jgi:SAM-dependent methyltransferase
MKPRTLSQVREYMFRAAARPVHFFLEQSLRDRRTRAWLLHTMGNNNAMTESGIAAFVPESLERISAFEDCAWLYSSNPLNHGASRLRLDEAAFLYRFVHNLSSPHVVEIGRYKGGTTILLAAAGATVLSLDNGRIPGQAALDGSLKETLDRLGLGVRCVTATAEALEYPVRPQSYDLVLLDIGLDDRDTTRKVFERWWDAVRPGCYFLFRDGKDTVLSEAAAFVTELPESDIGGSMNFHLPGSFVLCTKDAL